MSVAELFAGHAADRTDPPPGPEPAPSRFPNLDRALTGAAVLDAPALPASVWGRGHRVVWAGGQALMIAAHQGLGKTTLAQQLILHRLGIRSGGLLGLPVTPLPPEGRVLLLAMDRPTQALGSMRRMVGEEHRAELAARLVVWPGPLPFSLLDDPLALAEFVHDVCPGVRDVVVDSVKDLAAGISKDEVGAALNTAWQEVLMTGTELLLLHHQRKAPQGQSRLNTLDDVYGSTWLTSGLGSVLVFEGTPGSPDVTVKHLKPVAEPLDDTHAHHDHATGTTTLGRGPVVRPTLVEHLQQCGRNGSTVEAVAAATLGDPAPDPATRKRIVRELGRLVRDGNVSKAAGARTKGGATPDVWTWTGAGVPDAAAQRAAADAMTAGLHNRRSEPRDTPRDTAAEASVNVQVSGECHGTKPRDTAPNAEPPDKPRDPRDTK